MDENLVYSWYEQYKNGIFRYILSMTHDPHLSEDVLQDTFVQLLISNVRLAPGHSCRLDCFTGQVYTDVVYRYQLRNVINLFYSYIVLDSSPQSI